MRSPITLRPHLIQTLFGWSFTHYFCHGKNGAIMTTAAIEQLPSWYPMWMEEILKLYYPDLKRFNNNATTVVGTRAAKGAKQYVLSCCNESWTQYSPNEFEQEIADLVVQINQLNQQPLYAFPGPCNTTRDWMFIQLALLIGWNPDPQEQEN